MYLLGTFIKLICKIVWSKLKKEEDETKKGSASFNPHWKIFEALSIYGLLYYNGALSKFL